MKTAGQVPGQEHRLSVTHCDHCGLPAAKVGGLGSDGACRYCASDWEGFQALTQEVEGRMRAILDEFYCDCKAREVAPAKVAATAQAALENLLGSVAETGTLRA